MTADQVSVIFAAAFAICAAWLIWDIRRFTRAVRDDAARYTAVIKRALHEDFLSIAWAADQGLPIPRRFGDPCGCAYAYAPDGEFAYIPCSRHGDALDQLDKQVSK
jgi:hypothetical protein